MKMATTIKSTMQVKSMTRIRVLIKELQRLIKLSNLQVSCLPINSNSMFQRKRRALLQSHKRTMVSNTATNITKRKLPLRRDRSCKKRKQWGIIQVRIPSVKKTRSQRCSSRCPRFSIIKVKWKGALKGKSRANLLPAKWPSSTRGGCPPLRSLLTPLKGSSIQYRRP